ncbi:hypothetical protein HYFRA_00000374 [Hymenoscyphus fraxineus]|uniref:DNA-directed RNA polymerase subunit n=1 Tax=Hymenoscyphus fraxineus TaxID=746836 RepID=A0A9N9L0Q7_9HELO|nr:hypothetical protein HYFRA_00000374 [Hymenoscyphus fraxineus]
MLLFCPNCSNVLSVSKVPMDSPIEEERGKNRMECRTCPYQYVINEQSFFERKNFTFVEKDDVFGGANQFDNADKTPVQCPKDGCNGAEAAFYSIQIRSADEPMTNFYRCMTCGNRWRD